MAIGIAVPKPTSVSLTILRVEGFRPRASQLDLEGIWMSLRRQLAPPRVSNMGIVQNYSRGNNRAE